MAFRYIGSKVRLAEAILESVGRPSGGRFLDVFCGTGAVGEAAARAGWRVLLNDHLQSAVTVAGARLTTAAQAPFAALRGYDSAIAALNQAPSREGFIWREYSPASARRVGIERRYFTEANASRLDGIRTAIADWHRDQRISNAEYRLLLADLIGAANRVANTAGTYGCFLSRWQPQALQSLHLQARSLPHDLPPFETSNLDARSIECEPADVAYLDPPYTKRQYAAYYHILETLTLGDEPEVSGVCGIRPWRHKASDYCYRTRAVRALKDLVAGLDARVVLLSYSDEGHVPLAVLQEALSPLGQVTLEPLLTVGRYRPNAAASRTRARVSEVIVRIERACETLEAAA